MDFSVIQATTQIKEKTSETVFKWLVDKLQEKRFPNEFKATELIDIYNKEMKKDESERDDDFKYDGAFIPTLNGNLTPALRKLNIGFNDEGQEIKDANEIKKRKEQLLEVWGVALKFIPKVGYSTIFKEEDTAQNTPNKKPTKKTKK